MSCRYCRERLSAYLDSELNPEELAQVQGHLDSCQACFAEYRALSETKRALASLGARCSRDEIERLLQTDVGEAVRRYANMPVSPRTVAAAILSFLGIWVATTRLTSREGRHGAPLPDGAYLVPISQEQAPQAFNGASVILSVVEVRTAPMPPQACMLVPMGASVVGPSVMLCAPPPQPVRPVTSVRPTLYLSASVWSR